LVGTRTRCSTLLEVFVASRCSSRVSAIVSNQAGALTAMVSPLAQKFELTAWFQEKDAPVELFLDAHALMHAVRAPVVHQDEASRNLKSQRKTFMATGLQSAAISSSETILPSVLVGNMKTGSGGSYDWLHSYLKTFSVREPTGHKNGVRRFGVSCRALAVGRWGSSHTFSFRWIARLYQDYAQ
jgi:hypothetical protein